LEKKISIYIFVQLDFGIHPGLSGRNALPFIDNIDPEELDLLLISQ
jgi:cleavage and polyadenylation specificity factor subunit 3